MTKCILVAGNIFIGNVVFDIFVEHLFENLRRRAGEHK